jgi:hypothetical protein
MGGEGGRRKEKDREGERKRTKEGGGRKEK